MSRGLGDVYKRQGSGPATIMVVNKDKLDKFIENMGEHRLIVANVNNGDFNETSS